MEEEIDRKEIDRKERKKERKKERRKEVEKTNNLKLETTLTIYSLSYHP